jgi:hypothetical protein
MTSALLVGRLPHLEIPRGIVNASWRHVARRGDGRREAEVVWAGVLTKHGGRVVTAVAPAGAGVRASARFHGLAVATHAAMCRWIETHQLLVLAQVHTHPETWVGHSPTDDAHPFAPDEGFLSIVWPHYAAGRLAPLEQWGVHELVGGTWQQLAHSEVQRRIVVVASDPPGVTPLLVEVG